MIKVWKAFFNFENEEKWLNDMAAKGLNLVKYSFVRYTFEEGTPGEYIYRIELLENLPSHPDSMKYIDFMKEAGIECVDTYFRWVYFRKKSSEGPFDLYSDYASRIKHYKRVATLAGILAAANLCSAIVNLNLGLMGGHQGGSPLNAYVSIVNWVVVFILSPMVVSFVSKIRKMEKEKQLYE